MDAYELIVYKIIKAGLMLLSPEARKRELEAVAGDNTTSRENLAVFIDKMVAVVGISAEASANSTPQAEEILKSIDGKQVAVGADEAFIEAILQLRDELCFQQ